jgi:hypothetical protein
MKSEALERRQMSDGSGRCLSGRWSDDDYDVLENGVVVGRLQGAGPAAESALDVGERS